MVTFGQRTCPSTSPTCPSPSCSRPPACSSSTGSVRKPDRPGTADCTLVNDAALCYALRARDASAIVTVNGGWRKDGAGDAGLRGRPPVVAADRGGGPADLHGGGGRGLCRWPLAAAAPRRARVPVAGDRAVALGIGRILAAAGDRA